MRRAAAILQLACVTCLLGCTAPLLAQSPEGKVHKEEPAAASPCCGVVAVDTRARIVTAREMATGYTFRFKVRDRRLLESFTVGRKLWADFAAKQIWLSPPKPVAITWLPTTPAPADTARKPPQGDNENTKPTNHNRSTINRSST